MDTATKLWRNCVNLLWHPEGRKRGQALHGHEVKKSVDQGAEVKIKISDDIPKWIEDGKSFRRRMYQTYDDYLEHQKAKLAQIDLSTYHVKYREMLRDRLDELKLLKPGDRVLCLGARLGTECLAFTDLGCLAIGIDLNPGANNKYVLYGDFHELQFPNECFDYVFTNALDHVHDLYRVLNEVRRVLARDGAFIAEIVRGSRDISGREPGQFESYWWNSVDDVVKLIEEFGCVTKQRCRFSYPWEGDELVFQIKKTEFST